MAGYDERARSAVADPWSPERSAAFFPYGAHFLFAVPKLLLGLDDQRGNAVLLAVLGALIPLYTFGIARRVTNRRGLALAAGWILVFYYPLISLGGYLLSEVPFCAA